MSDAQNLESFFAAEDAPKRDAGFRIAIMERAARKRLSRALVREFAFFVAAALAFWFVAPILVMNVVAMGPALTTILTALLAVAVVAYAGHLIVRQRGFGKRRVV